MVCYKSADWHNLAFDPLAVRFETFIFVRKHIKQRTIMCTLCKTMVAKLLYRICRAGSRITNAIQRPHLNFALKAICNTKCFGSDYARYCVCADTVTERSIVYSFGVGEDIEFDLAMIREFAVDVFAFDPTPKSVRWIQSQQLPREFKFFQFGIADFDGVAEFFPVEDPDDISYTIVCGQKAADNTIKVNVRRLKTIQRMLNHEKVHVLKLDVEGAEYAVINDIIASGVIIDQLLVEFHHGFKNIGIADTKRTIELLDSNGYKLFYMSSDLAEYSFIRQDLLNF